MALTFLDVVANVDLDQGLAFRVIKVTLDNSYPTGGEAVTAAQCQLASITSAIVMQDAGADTNSVRATWDHTNLKIMCWRTDQVDDFQEQIPNATDLSTVTLYMWVVGVPEVASN
jgi:hypothetical protein